MFSCECKKFALSLLQINPDMKSEINVPVDIFLDLYAALVLLTMLHSTPDDKNVNTNIQIMEELYKNQVGESILSR